MAMSELNPAAQEEMQRRAIKYLFRDGLTVESWFAIYRHIEATDWLLPFFFGLAANKNEVKVGEIGMRHGTSTVAFLMGARNSGGHVYSMDIETCDDARRNIAAFGLTPYHTFGHGDSKEMDFPVPLDILFIDGDHTYEGVKADYERHSPMVKKGGLILFHDTLSCPNAVGRYCREIGVFSLDYAKSGLGMQVKA